MKLFFIALLSSLSLSTCLPAFAANLPARVSLSYSMKVSGMSAEVKETLETKRVRGAGSGIRSSYTITSEARAKGALALLQQGSIVRSSQGVVTNKGLQPLRFSDQRGNRQPAVAIFEWAKKLLTLQHKGNEQQTALPVGTQDRLSMFYSTVKHTQPILSADRQGCLLFIAFMLQRQQFLCPFKNCHSGLPVTALIRKPQRLQPFVCNHPLAAAHDAALL